MQDRVPDRKLAEPLALFAVSSPNAGLRLTPLRWLRGAGKANH